MYGTGAVRDQLDLRDHKYEQAFAAPFLSDEEWSEGFDAEEKLGIKLKVENQNGSSSCVAQATSKLFELKTYEKLRDMDDRSSKFIYANINLGAGVGAYIRDGLRFAADNGCVLEEQVPSYENNQPPSERFMIDKSSIPPEAYQEAKKADYFNYRVIGEPDNINTVAHAIKTNLGVVMGFIGSNQGWQTGIVRAPLQNEPKWGHAVIATQFGQDSKGRWIGGLNSWGLNWGLDGYWKAYEDYFSGGLVFNPWVFVWDVLIPDEIKIMDFLNKNEGKIIQDSEQSGSFALIKNGQALVATKERVAELIATYLVRREGVPTPKDIWNGLPKSEF